MAQNKVKRLLAYSSMGHVGNLSIDILWVLWILWQLYGVLSLSTNLTRDQRLITAILSWLIVISVLILFVRVLSNIVDTVYICYAMDKDQGVASKPEIHNVLAELPGDNPALAVRRDV